MQYLAQQPEGTIALITDIANAAAAPRNFTAKILQSLAKARLVTSYRGTGGGFALARPARAITVREIVEAMDGPIMPNRCLMGQGACVRDRTCLVHPIWREVQSAVIKILNRATLADLVATQTSKGHRGA